MRRHADPKGLHMIVDCKNKELTRISPEMREDVPVRAT